MDNNLAAMVKPLLHWYNENKRTLPWRGTKDPYRVLVSEIMLQQTRVAAVIPYYLRWMEELPTVEALAAVDEERLMKLWQGLGYYSRARNLRKAALMLMDEYGGQFPEDHDALLRLPGGGLHRRPCRFRWDGAPFWSRKYPRHELARQCHLQCQ